MDTKDNILFNDIFEVKDLDRDGKKFDRVSRINARSENYEMDLILDFACELYSLDINDKFTLVIATSLSRDGSLRDDKESWRAVDEKTLGDDYDYVMYGKVYKYEESGGSKVAVYVSYGGLLMCLEGDYRHLQNFTVGEHVFLLMRK